MLWNPYRGRQPRVGLQLEALEDRSTPATLVGLTTTDRLITFDSATPNVIQRNVKITGVGAQDVVSIDARPSNGLVYALTNANRLYTVNTFSGVATRVGVDPVGFPLGLGRVGIDFNPVVDRLRVTTSADLNFRYNPVTGTVVDGDAGTAGVQPDTNLAFAAGDPNSGDNPQVVEVAYDRSFQGTTLTTLFGIDAAQNALVRIGSVNGTPASPNGGQLFTVANLSADPGGGLGFDIAADGTAFAAFRGANGVALLKLFTVDLTTGVVTNKGLIGAGGAQLDGLTVLPCEEIVYAVTVSNRLISFRADQPGRILTAVALKGLIAGENVTDIDFRPTTGELFGLTSSNRVVRIDTATGQTTQLGVPIVTNPLFTANSPGGFDFNPTVDRLRLVNVADDNLRFNPSNFTPVDGDGNAANGNSPDTDLAFILADVNAGKDPNIVGCAYDRNDNDGATATTLWGIDSTQNILVRQGAVDGDGADLAGGGSPNGGLLTTMGLLNVDPTDLVGFDISGPGIAGVGAALAVMQLQGETTSRLFSINLNAGLTNQPLGSAALVGIVGGGELIRAMAIAPPQIQFKSAAYSVNEAAGTTTITITRTGGASGTSTVSFSAFGGTATEGSDYTPVFNMIFVFNPGETAIKFTIPIVNDTEIESPETVLLTLAAPTGGNTILGPNSSATLTIVSNE